MPVQERSKHFSSILFLLVSLGLISYFIYHALQGNHGLKARTHLKWRVERLERQHAELSKLRTQIERDVALLKPEKIDPDMLDQQARKLLNIVHSDDIIILRPRVKKEKAVMP